MSYGPDNESGFSLLYCRKLVPCILLLYFVHENELVYNPMYTTYIYRRACLMASLRLDGSRARYEIKVCDLCFTPYAYL